MFASLHQEVNRCAPALWDPVETLAVAAQLLGEHLGADRSYYVLAEETAERTRAAVEKAKAEEALCYTEQKLRTVLQLAPLVIATTGSAGVKLNLYQQQGGSLTNFEPELSTPQSGLPVTERSL